MEQGRERIEAFVRRYWREALVVAVAVLLGLLLVLRVSSDRPVDRPDFVMACGYKVRADWVDVTTMRKDCGIFGPGHADQ